MSITNITRNLDWVYPGDRVTITATIDTGQRYRVKLVEKPADSTLELFSASRQNYLANNAFTPDAAGRYTVAVVEESVSLPVPKFSNDFGGPSGKGVEVIMVHPTVVGPDTFYQMTAYVSVGERATRQIGLGADQATVEVWSGADERAAWPATIEGVVTHYADATHCPRIIEPRTSAARLAAQDSGVGKALRAIGGYQNESYQYGQRYGESAPVLTWSAVADATPFTRLAWFIDRLNWHIRGDRVKVHATADAANTIATADCAPGDATSQINLLNAILSKLASHAGVGAGVVHHDADTVCTTACTALASLAAGATLAARIDRVNALFDIVDGHLTRTWLALGGTTYAHNDLADNHLDYATLYPATDEASLVLSANALKAGHNAHLARVSLLASGYHLSPGSASGGEACTYTGTNPDERESYIRAVGQLSQVLHAHVTNTNPVTGVNEGYHTAPDWSSRSDMLGAPNDFQTALLHHEVLEWLLAKHAGRGASVHGMAHAGNAAIRPVGIEAINHAFLSALTAQTITTPSTESVARAAFVQSGWTAD